jgi:hypothetical protein
MNKTLSHLLSLAALIALPALSQAEVSVTPAQAGAPWRWEDRRPIAQLFVSQQANRTTANPDGYLNQDVNVTTEEGRAAFRTNLLAYADRCIKIIKDMDGQGFVVWDLEGYQQPSMVYVGDPRILPEYAPAMDKVADEFFRKFREAGLRTGLTIRPNRIFRIPPEGVAKWGKWGYLLYDDQKDNVVKELGERVAYARKRWGCTLFYMDSNGYETWENGKKKSVTIPAALLKQLHELHPDVLIIPEHPTPGGHEWTAQYRELRGGWKGTPDAERQEYPGAFSVLSLGGGVPDATERNWEALATSIAQGDIAFFEGWYPSGGNREVKDLYRQADYQKRAAEVDPGSNLERLLTLSGDTNAAVRFNAVRALTAKRDAVVPRLQAMLKDEPDWLVRKEVIVALGTIQGVDAIPMLVAEIERAAYGQHLAALEQLRKHGEAALPAALELANGAKPQTRADAATLLGAIATKPAAEALATLMGDQDPLVRQRATACFKKIPGAVKMIVPALGDDGKEPDAALESDGPAARGTEPL